MRLQKLVLGGLCLVLAQAALNGCTEKKQTLLGKDTVENVIAAMTADEKIGMTVGDGKFLPAGDAKSTEQGLGIIIANQNSKLVIPRLLVGTSALTDGPSGINRDPHPAGATDYTYTTAWPTSTCMAATWNMELMEKRSATKYWSTITMWC